MTAPTGPLADAAARLSRLLPVRPSQPAHAGVLLRADHAGLVLAATDGELSAQVRVPGTTHETGEVVDAGRI